METIIVLFVTLCPAYADRCYRSVESRYESVDECLIDLSMEIGNASSTRYYQCITERKAQVLLAQNPQK